MDRGIASCNNLLRRNSPVTEPKDEIREGGDEHVDRARRKLLKASVYAAPAVLTTVVVRRAHAQGTSCVPAGCPPNVGPCPPDKGCPPSFYP